MRLAMSVEFTVRLATNNMLDGGPQTVMSVFVNYLRFG